MTIGGEEAASYVYNEDGQFTGIDTPHGNVSFGLRPRRQDRARRSPTATGELLLRTGLRAGRHRLREPRRRPDREPRNTRVTPSAASRRRPAASPAQTSPKPSASHLQRCERADRPRRHHPLLRRRRQPHGRRLRSYTYNDRNQLTDSPRDRTPGALPTTRSDAAPPRP